MGPGVPRGESARGRHGQGPAPSAVGYAIDFRDAIEAEREPRPPFRRRLSGLREARNDLLEWAGYASGAEMRKLDQHLKSSIGLSHDDLQSTRLARLAKIRAAGRITTDEQFRLVFSRVEQIWDDPERREEFDALNRLMIAYESESKPDARGVDVVPVSPQMQLDLASYSAVPRSLCV